MQQLKYTPEEEQKLMSQLWSPMISDDPEAFVLFTFPWGQVNTPLEKFTGPRKWQRKVLRQIRDHIRANNGVLTPDAFKVLYMAVASGRGIGKSALVAWLVLWMLTTKIGSSVVVSANTENQLRSTTWGELTKWVTMALNSHWWEVSATKLVPAKWLSDLVERDLKKGTRYWAAEGKLWSEENPDGYAGVHNHDGMMVIFDEASGIPDSIWSVAEGFFTEPISNRYWFAFSNPRRNSGAFYECFHSSRDYWVTEQIDGRDVEGADKNTYQRLIDTKGADSRQARVEVYGQFPLDGDDQFISPSMVDDAMAREAHNDDTAPIVIGVDPSGNGGDKAVIVVRKGHDIVSIKRVNMGRSEKDTMMLVGAVIDHIETWKPTLTVIDQGGLGFPIMNRINEQRYKVRGVDFGWKSKYPKQYVNKRAEMWGLMREWLANAHLPDDRDLKQDLTGPNEEFDSSGAIQVESKKKMKARGQASPDSADAIAVTFAFSVAHRQEKSQKGDNKRHMRYDSSNYATSWMAI
jgi:hypothetical protein